MFQSQPRCQAPGDATEHGYSQAERDVSISTEMPGPWRPVFGEWSPHHLTMFQSQPRCQAPGDCGGMKEKDKRSTFQSQPRCQAPGDYNLPHRQGQPQPVSISTEMPGPWRRSVLQLIQMLFLGFNLNRDARPLATGKDGLQGISINYVSIST